MKRILSGVSVLIIMTFAGCGGGGNSGGNVEENLIGAVVNIDANPRTIFVGDRTRVEVVLEGVDPQGLVLKFRYPDNLEYVNNSATLEVLDEYFPIHPTVEDDRAENMFLVFVFRPGIFPDDRYGIVRFELLADRRDGEARIEVDPSVRDLNLEDDDQFSISDPNFGTDEEIVIRVKK